MISLLWKCFIFYSFAILQLPTQNVLVKGLNPGVKRELWQAIPGDTVANLTSSAKYQNEAPDLLTILTSLEAPPDIGHFYGQKLTTYFLAPETGDYLFYMSCDTSCQLWISRDESPLNIVMIIEIEPPGKRTGQDWQKSNTPIHMVENNFYFLKALMKEQNGTDFLSVGVDFPQGSSFKPIREPYLFLESPEHLTGSFIQAKSYVIPLKGQLRSYSSVGSQTICAHYCIQYVAMCMSYSYHVITQKCVLYNVTGTESGTNMIHWDQNRRLYVKTL